MNLLLNYKIKFTYIARYEFYMIYLQYYRINIEEQKQTAPQIQYFRPAL